jgi:transaldolase
MSDTIGARDPDFLAGAQWELTRLGQSIWLDYIRRGLLDDGGLERMITELAVRGVTSNPAIFEQAIVASRDYDVALERLAAEGATVAEAYEALVIEDIQRAADIFREIYDSSAGADGYVSLEVSPELAYDAQGSLEEARRLWAAVNRPNLMIKIPGTAECGPAIEELLREGINVNVTLLFSRESYDRVIDAYLRAMERRVAEGKPLERIASVASFFVSRVDAAVDELLQRKLGEASEDVDRARVASLLGKAAIANAKLAYELFRERFTSERFAALAALGAQVQRPLWASTSTKNPAYRDVIYVEELIGHDTVNTVPLQTLEAFADHGVARSTLEQNVEQAKADLAALAGEGIDLDRITAQLQADGVEKFVIPFRRMLARLDESLAAAATHR